MLITCVKKLKVCSCEAVTNLVGFNIRESVQDNIPQLIHRFYTSFNKGNILSISILLFSYEKVNP